MTNSESASGGWIRMRTMLKLPTITKRKEAFVMVKNERMLRPIHPGEVLKTVLEDAGLSANAVALGLRVPANRLTEILNERRSISADTALRLARYFGTSAEMWMNLQSKFDLETAQDALASRIEEEVKPMKRPS